MEYVIWQAFCEKFYRPLQKQGKMKSTAYTFGFPRLRKLCVYLSIIAVLAFMTCLFQGPDVSDDELMEDELALEKEFESLFYVTSE